jgi:hypothetical protein
MFYSAPTTLNDLRIPACSISDALFNRRSGDSPQLLLLFDPQRLAVKTRGCGTTPGRQIRDLNFMYSYSLLPAMSLRGADNASVPVLPNSGAQHICVQ